MKPVLWCFDFIYQHIESLYTHTIKKAIRIPIVTLFVIVSISAASLPLTKQLGVELIPSMSQGEFYVEVILPSGSRLENTDTLLGELAEFTQSQQKVAKTYSLAGTGSLLNASPAQGGDHWGRLNVVLHDSSNKSDENALKNQLREKLRQYPDAVAKFGTPELFTFSTPVEIELIGYDLATLNKYSQRLVALLEESERFVDAKSTLQEGNPEMRIRFDHEQLAQLGLTAPQVSRLISTKIGGEVASKFSINDRKIDILVRSQEQQRDSIEDISQIIVNPGSTNPVPLHAVAAINVATGPSEITRIAQQRVAVISANIAYGDLGEAVREAQNIIPELKLPLRIEAKISGQNEEMESSFQSLKFALLLAVFLVYLVMASQFESLLHPFLILFTVPLACAGSIFGLYITGTNVSVVVFIGLIMLAGIVVNNAIVLVDRINQLRQQGVEKSEAILTAASNRLRPIMMTTLTTVLGLLPMVIASGDGAEIRLPMAITVIFGLLFATILTLFMIPCLYQLFDRKRYDTASNNTAQLNHSEAAYE
jgi:HAE1 family hydrophobic/amphiphilic exporter-1